MPTAPFASTPNVFNLYFEKQRSEKNYGLCEDFWYQKYFFTNKKNLLSYRNCFKQVERNRVRTMVVQYSLALVHLMTAVHSFDTGTLVTSNPEEAKKCFTCSVFTFIDNRLLCTNPGTCYGNYCYGYLLSDLRSMFLSGCAEDWSDFPFRKGVDDRILCHADGHFGLCLCKAGNDLCNKRYGNDTELQWMNSNGIIMNSISHKVTGFTADYARNRVLQMRVHGYPETFPGTPLNFARYILSPMVFLISSTFIEFHQT